METSRSTAGIADRIRTSAALLCLACCGAVFAATPIDTVIARLDKTYAALSSFRAEFTVREKSNGVCVSLPVRWTYARPDTLQVRIARNTSPDTVWSWFSISQGGSGDEEPSWAYPLLKPIMSPVLTAGWKDMIFPASVAEETADQIKVTHMATSVPLAYYIDKNRWLITRAMATSFQVWDISYRYGQQNGVYYPTSVLIAGDTTLCDSVMTFARIVLNGSVAPAASVRGPQSARRPGPAAIRETGPVGTWYDVRGRIIGSHYSPGLRMIMRDDRNPECLLLRRR